MPLSQEVVSAFREAALAVRSQFAESGIPASGQVTPIDLADALEQFIDVFEKLDREEGDNGLILSDDASQLGEHALNCVADLAYWAERLKLPREKSAIEGLSLTLAHWMVRHKAEIRVLEPIVNALALSANKTSENSTLKSLYKVISDIIEQAAPAIRQDLEKQDTGRPWRIINLNAAIVATRSQDTELMKAAYEALGRNLPQDCPAFFEEGMKQLARPEFSDAVRQVMSTYAQRWNSTPTLH
jgi:hypothetical protein